MAIAGLRLADEPAQGNEAGIIGRQCIIDEEHLTRMTLGDRRLEREVLQIFLRQTAIMLDRIVGPEPDVATAAAHTLTGSARGIGAWRLAKAAERLQQATGQQGSNGDVGEAIAELKSASLEASAAIAARLGLPRDRSDQPAVFD